MARRQSYLKLTLQGEVLESAPGLGLFRSKDSLRQYDLLTLLEKAATNRKVEKILISLKMPGLGWAQIDEIRAALQNCSRSGKEVIAYLENADPQIFFLASGCDRILVPPSANLDLVGLRFESFFLQELLQFLGVKAELIQIGRYKSAGELFSRKEMSAPAREMMESILEDLTARLCAAVSEGRSLSREEVGEILDRGPYTAEEARELGLVDEIAYEDQIEKQLKEIPLDRLSLRKVAAREGRLKRLLTYRRPQIGVITLEGLLASGDSKSRPGRLAVAGSRSLSALVRQARQSKRIRAVVLRISSPGGSTLASDLVWRELWRLNEKKPLLVSFGNVAASGGYYVATAGRKIFANPSTLTGSIGVIGGKFSAPGLLEKLRISVDSVERGAHAGYQSVARSFTDSEVKQVEGLMRHFYENLFLPKVVDHTGLELEQVRDRAEGRVWTGKQAGERRLIAELGGFLEAIASARESAELADRSIRIVHLTPRKSWKDFLPLSLHTLTDLRRERLFAVTPFPWRIL